MNKSPKFCFFPIPEQLLSLTMNHSQNALVSDAQLKYIFGVSVRSSLLVASCFKFGVLSSPWRCIYVYTAVDLYIYGDVGRCVSACPLLEYVSKWGRLPGEQVPRARRAGGGE